MFYDAASNFMQQHVYSIALTCKLLGVKHVVISPGSRSAPLVFAFAGQKSFTTHTVIDERSAAYQALGMAQQTHKPVVLICTSGTAAANYLPAVTEAFYQHIPLVVITADRPEELLHQQDGQMINQVNLFGTHVKHFCQLPSYPHHQPNFKETTRLVADALAHAGGQTMGPVHINVPLTEPLYDKLPPSTKLRELEKNTEHWLRTHLHSSSSSSQTPNFADVEHAWINSKKRMLLIGQGMMHESWITPLLKLQQQKEVLILGDLTSNKNEYTTITNFDKLISSASPQLLKELQPDVLITLGGPVLSKSLKNWLRGQQPKWHFRIQPIGPVVNTYQNITHVLHNQVSDVLQQLSVIDLEDKTPAQAYINKWKQASAQLQSRLTAFLNKPIWSELHAVNSVMKALPIGANLQLANSSSVRYVSWLGQHLPGLIINSNRGTSGIDGCTSTAVGAAMVNLRPTVLLTGDLAFLYDRNALWQSQLPPNLRIVVLNNGGGGIFTLIDGPTRNQAFKQFFTTPQPKSMIKDVAGEFGLDYYFCDSPSRLTKTLDDFFNPLHQASVLELKFDMKKNAQVFQQFKNIK